MLKQYDELSVLEQGDDGAIVSIRGQGGPSVLLGPAYLGHLERVARKASAELESAALVLPRGGERDPKSASALALLVQEVATLLATYNETCNKFEGGEAAPKSLASALEELAEMRERLARFL
jgi:hypothetical protein